MRTGRGMHMGMGMGMATGLGKGQKGCRTEKGRALGWVCLRARGRAGSPQHAGQSVKWDLPCVSFPPRSAACRDGNPTGAFPLAAAAWALELPGAGVTPGRAPSLRRAPQHLCGQPPSPASELINNRDAESTGVRQCPASPPRVSWVKHSLCLQYYSGGEDTTVQFRHCRFLICLFIIQKLAHILMNP